MAPHFLLRFPLDRLHLFAKGFSGRQSSFTQLSFWILEILPIFPTGLGMAMVPALLAARYCVNPWHLFLSGKVFAKCSLILSESSASC